MSSPQIKAIETVYNNYRFRSRLEARWAVFFDALGISYQYEPEGFDFDGIRYLPDFWLPKQDCWIEIKGQKPTPQEHRKAASLALNTNKSAYLFWGDIWIPDLTDSYYDDEPTRPLPHWDKSAWRYDPSEAMLLGIDEASPCIGNFCPHEQGCPGVYEIPNSPLVRAFYLADLNSSEGGDCYLQVTEEGIVEFLIPVYAGPRQPIYLKPRPTGLPVQIQAYEQEYLHTFGERKGSWLWRTGNLMPLSGNGGFAWCECPFCSRLEIVYEGKIGNLSCQCYKHRLQDRSSRPMSDQYSFSESVGYESHRLIEAYTTARQARFEYGETPSLIKKPRKRTKKSRTWK